MFLITTERETVRQALEAYFPWLATDEEIQISGADTIDQLCSLYREVGGVNIPRLAEMPAPDSGEELGWAFRSSCDSSL